MRLSVVLAGLSLALSGCIGGHVTVSRDNETADAAPDGPDDAAGDEAPPWLLEDDAAAGTAPSKDAATDGGSKTSGSKTNSGSSSGSTSDSTSDSGSTGGDSGSDPDASGGGGDSGDDPLADAPTEGAAGTDATIEDVASGADQTVTDATTSNGSKDPVGDARDDGTDAVDGLLT